MNPEKKLSAKQDSALASLAKRRLKGEPIAYLVGFKDFCGLRFKADKRALVPRPETEMAVELAGSQIKKLAKPDRDLRVLDVGTGSGCIIISLAKSVAKGIFASGKDSLCQFYASDISAEALKVARRNASEHKVKVKFFNSDLLTGIKCDFDIIIANLPYGWAEWKNNSSAQTASLKFEPQQALFTKERGLCEIRRLLEQVSRIRPRPKLVFLEFDPRQKQALGRLVKRVLPQASVFFHRDFRGLWRYAEIQTDEK